MTGRGLPFLTGVTGWGLPSLTGVTGRGLPSLTGVTGRGLPVTPVKLDKKSRNVENFRILVAKGGFL